MKGYVQYNYIFEQGQRKRIQYNTPEKHIKMHLNVYILDKQL